MPFTQRAATCMQGCSTITEPQNRNPAEHSSEESYPMVWRQPAAETACWPGPVGTGTCQHSIQWWHRWLFQVQVSLVKEARWEGTPGWGAGGGWWWWWWRWEKPKMTGWQWGGSGDVSGDIRERGKERIFVRRCCRPFRRVTQTLTSKSYHVVSERAWQESCTNWQTSKTMNQCLAQYQRPSLGRQAMMRRWF